MRRKIACVILSLCVTATISSSAYAVRTWDPQPGYWNNPTLTIWDVSNYQTSVKRAADGWNALNTKAHLNYYSTQPSYYQVEVESKQIYQDWVGATTITLFNGVTESPEDASYATWDPSQPYSFAWITLNEWSISSHNMTYDQRTNTAGHELGHALAAGHDADSRYIMYNTVANSSAVLAGWDEQQQMIAKYGY